MSFSDKKKKKNGYIYLRDNPWYQSENVYKMGISFSLLDRGDTYRTGEFQGGHFPLVIDVGSCSRSRLHVIENLLAHHFQSYHRCNEGGGREFYDRSIIDHVPSFLSECQIPFWIIQEDDIQSRIRYENYQKYKHLLRRMFDRWSHQYQNLLKPYDFQKDVLQHVPLFFQNHDKLKLIWPCGLGKALFGMFIVKKMRFKTVLIGVPSIDLQKQMKEEILRMFPEQDNILCIGSVETTSNDIITDFMVKDTQEPRFVITTYHSCHLFRDIDFTFDFKIGDEAHHLVGTPENAFCAFHQIKSANSLFMTATEKTIEIKYPLETILYSMDDENAFGYCIDRKTVKWAVENKKITDYSILVLKNTEEEVDTIIRKNGFSVQKKELFLSCYMCLKAMEKYEGLSHILLYTNTVDNSILAAQYIDTILSKGLISLVDADDFYNNALHSRQHINTIYIEKEKFKQSRRGIISCVYLFGEGFDMPQLNGVCVADNMQSEIRIVQYLLRPNRLDRKNPDKKAFIVLPYMDMDDWERETQSFEKIRKIISQMRNSDDTIEQKICFCTVQEPPPPDERTSVEEQTSIIDQHLFESVSDLEQLKLRLRWSKTLRSKNTEEEDEYQYIRSLNKSLGITSEKEYILSRTRHPYYIENADSYFKSKGVWRGWKDYLDINDCAFLSWDEWREFCREYKITTREEYEEQCERYPKLPKEPELVYERFGFRNLLRELMRLNKNKRGR